MLSMSLPSVLSRAIGRYALALVESGFSGFQMTMVVVDLKGVGKCDVLMDAWTRAGRC